VERQVQESQLRQPAGPCQRSQSRIPQVIAVQVQFLEPAQVGRTSQVAHTVRVERIDIVVDEVQTAQVSQGRASSQFTGMRAGPAEAEVTQWGETEEGGG